MTGEDLDKPQRGVGCDRIVAVALLFLKVNMYWCIVELILHNNLGFKCSALLISSFLDPVSMQSS